MLKRSAYLVAALGIGLFALLFFAQTAQAATFTVDSVDDGGNAGGPGVCDDGGGKCTLRAAIEAANTTAGADVINFAIPGGGGVNTITPGSDYPDITEQLTINGETQNNPSYPTIAPDGASCGTLVPASLPASSNTPHVLKIEIDGTSVNRVFSLAASNITLRGLAIHDGSTAVYGNSSINNTLIECNYIGTNPPGTAAEGGTEGINLQSNNNSTIQNNLLSGTNNTGMFIYNSSNVLIQNNLVGTTAIGTQALGNGSIGIYTYNLTNATISHNIVAANGGGGTRDDLGTSTTFTGNLVGIGLSGSPLGNTGDGAIFKGSNGFVVGGTSATLRNVMSANTGDGLHIFANCDVGSSLVSNTYGNYIGTNTDGTVQSVFGNGKAGIEVNEYQGNCGSVYKHQIGGDSAGQANIIAGNGAQGILIHQDTNHDVFSITAIVNSIYGNGQFGIDLAADSSTTNGVADTDLGPNPLNLLAMTYPTTVANYYLNTTIVNSATYSGNQVTVNYSLQANPAQNSSDGVSLLASDLVGYRLDFYINSGGQDGAYAGYGQGKTHLGSFIVNGSETNANHTFISSVALTNGQTITATTTVLWTNSPGPAITPRECDGETEREGNGPPYNYVGSCPM
ncbi:right-handed parallel beta-helix repeat-containing protein [Candidatus Saccharibacteria bacterium]|nr:right-handed parallel beta-helix repeat-containing protein [Candidatus Saccharibacteria bacterium]